MHVAFVIAELAPYAQVGGLGAVAADLPPRLARAGVPLTLVVPRHAGLVDVGDLAVSVDTDAGEATAWVADLAGVRLVSVDVAGLFGGPVYGDDDLSRFTRFSLAVPEVLDALGDLPDLYHLHDWHTAAVTMTSADVPTVLTIHNLAHQGWFDIDATGGFGLTGWFERDGWGSVLGTGIVRATAVNTVSPTYADEIRREPLGMGLGSLLDERAVSGIVNGIDVDRWNPASDPHLVARYDAVHLDGKAENRAALLDEFSLADTALPMAAIVSRFDHQKGLDLVLDAAAPLIADGRLALVALGTGDPVLEEGFRSLAASSPLVGYRADFDAGLVHTIEAGADMFLMPSRFEPCGLNQMYSMRYGTIPIVRRTGGLADTVEPWDATTGLGTGFVFDDATPEALRTAIDAAIDLHGSDPAAWQQLIRNAMARDFSWDRSAEAYVELYARVVAGVR